MRTFLGIVFLFVTLVSEVQAEVRGYVGANVVGIQPTGDFAETNPFSIGGGAGVGVGAGLEAGITSPNCDIYIAWRTAAHGAEWSGKSGSTVAEANGDWVVRLWMIGGRLSVVKLSRDTDLTLGSGVLLANATGNVEGDAYSSTVSGDFRISETATSTTNGGCF